MKQLFIILIFFVNLIYAQNIEFYKPSFDCDKVKKNSPEYIICTDKNLSKQDKALNDLYLHLLNITPKEKIETIKISQKDWIKNRQQQCLTWACMKKAYMDREKELKSLFFEKNISENFYYDNKPIHPGCLYQLLPELNGDNIVKKIDLINCCQVQTKNVPKCSVKMYHLVTPIC